MVVVPDASQPVSCFGNSASGEKTIRLFAYAHALFIEEETTREMSLSNRLQEFNADQLYVARFLAAFHPSLKRGHAGRH